MGAPPVDRGSPLPGPDPRESLERLLLGGPRRHTRLQVAALAGVPPERTQRLWRALGFADVADDDPALRRVPVRGYDQLRPWLVRRRTADDPPGAEAFEELRDELPDDVLDNPAEG